MFVSPQNSHVEIFTRNVVVLEDGTFKRWWLVDEGGALMNGIGALIKEALESSLSPSTMWRHSEKALAVNQEENSYQDFPELRGRKFLSFVNYLVYSILL